MGLSMGVSNDPIACKDTGLNHACFPAGKAPESVSILYSGMEKGDAWTSSFPLPQEIRKTLLWVSTSQYVYDGTDWYIVWEVTGGGSGFSCSVKPSYQALGFGLNPAEACVISFPGVDESYVRWKNGTFELKIREECYQGVHPWDAGDLMVVPRDADILSEITHEDSTYKSTRYARHRDKTNVLIQTT